MALRLAVITDLHHGRDTGNVKGPQALAVLEDFARSAHAAEPDAVIELGDRLTDENPVTDRAHLLEVARVFKRLPYPRHHLTGNHDLLPQSDQEAILETTLANHSAELNGWKLVFVDTFDGTTGGSVTDQTVQWLEAELRTALPVAVFSHQPLHGEWLSGNPYFESDYRDHACPRGADAARAVIEASKRVRVCIAGHAHWNDLRTVNGIPFVTLLSATESYWSRPEPSRAWALFTLAERIHVDVYGAQPEQYEF